MTSYRRILVPVDCSTPSDRGLDEAIALAQLTGARLRLVHVVDEFAYVDGFESAMNYLNEIIPLMRDAGQELLESGRAKALAKGVSVDTVLLDNVDGRVCDHIVEQAKAWDADLIVLGTHGRRGVGRMFLGSGAEQIMRLAPVPVLLVRAPARAKVVLHS